MPATSWPGWRSGPRRMSDTSRKVTYSPQSSIQHTNTMHKRVFSSTLVVQWSEQPCSMHEIMNSNPEIIHNFANSFFKENMVY